MVMYARDELGMYATDDFVIAKGDKWLRRVYWEVTEIQDLNRETFLQ